MPKGAEKVKAKDFVTEITIFNTREKRLRSEEAISAEHIKSNQGVRGVLLQRGIRPEDLPAKEDIKNLERRVKGEAKKLGKNPDKLGE